MLLPKKMKEMLMDFQQKEEQRNEGKMGTNDDRLSSLDVNSSALVQVKGIQVDSMTQFPSFWKQLLKSHLSGKFYLGLPKKFCDAHLPCQDVAIVLVDENEEEYSMTYSFRKNRLVGGWRRFSLAHKLLEGDALAFYLIGPCKFRVYTVRAGKFTEDDAIAQPPCDFQNAVPITSFRMEDHMEVNACPGKQKSNQESKRARLVSDTKLETCQSGNTIDHHFGSNLQEGIRYSEPVVYFEDVKSFEDFKIQVDGLILDSQIPRNLRTKYYNLCCSQNMFLHDHLIKGLSSKLAVVMISETTNIADCIRSADISTPLYQLECWERTLKAFEDLGMVVRYLRDRLHKLFSISRESQSIIESKRMKIAEADEEINNLEATPLKLKAFVGGLKAEIEALNMRNEKLNFEFRELAQFPW